MQHCTTGCWKRKPFVIINKRVRVLITFYNSHKFWHFFNQHPTPWQANSPHPKHPTSRTSHIPNIPHPKHPISQASHIPNSPIPNISHSQHLTSSTSHIPNIPRTQHPTFSTYYISNIPHNSNLSSYSTNFRIDASESLNNIQI